MGCPGNCPTLTPTLILTPSRSLRSTAGLEWGQAGLMAIGASKVLEGDSGTPNRQSPTTAINSPEKASRPLQTIHKGPCHCSWTFGAITSSTTRTFPCASLVHVILLGYTQLWASSRKSSLGAGCLGPWWGGKESWQMADAQGAHGSTVRRLWGSGRNPGLGVRRARLEPQLSSDLTG